MELSSSQRLFLELPKICQLAATNHALIGQRIRLAFGQLTRQANASAFEGLDRLLGMLEEQRKALLVMNSIEGDVESVAEHQPAAAHLHLYEAAVLAGDLAAASPWFDRYCDSVCKQALGFGVGESPAAKWRGPLTRKF